MFFINWTSQINALKGIQTNKKKHLKTLPAVPQKFSISLSLLDLKYVKPREEILTISGQTKAFSFGP